MRVAALLGNLVVSSLTAQIYVVDVAGGPGSHFTSLPAAVPDGAVLTVLGDPGVAVQSFGSQVIVRNLAATKSVALRRLRLDLVSRPYRCSPGMPPLGAVYLVPSQPTLLGARIAWQGVSVGAASQVSNCSTYVHW
jgi:hypothetical protein